MGWDVAMVEGVAVVTMNTNPVNAQNEEFFGDLHDALDRIEQLPPCAVVLTARGRTFSAGIDLKYTLPVFATRDQDAIGAWFARYRATNVRLFTFPRPTIAALNGHAYAGGLITALCCDYRIAARGDARFALNEVPIGIPMPAVYTEIIRHAVGTPTASLATLFGETFGGDAALRFGVVHQVVPAEDLLDAALQRARMVPPDALVAYRIAKRGLQAPAIWNIENLADPGDRRMFGEFVDPASIRAQQAKLSTLGAPARA